MITLRKIVEVKNANIVENHLEQPKQIRSMDFNGNASIIVSV